MYEENKRRFIAMNEERLTCISVRLTDEEYKNIKALAKKEYTTMSGILRKLLRDAVEGSKS